MMITTTVPRLPNLKRWRDSAALSQRDLARLAGVSRPTIASIEQGRSVARPSTLRKLADALKCEPRDLIGDG